MPAIDVAHVRFAAPDLDLMERFVADFGLQPFRADGVLYARGSGGAPFLHMTEPGDPAFVALGLTAPSVGALRDFAAGRGLAVQPIDRPGGASPARRAAAAARVVSAARTSASGLWRRRAARRDASTLAAARGRISRQ